MRWKSRLPRLIRPPGSGVIRARKILIAVGGAPSRPKINGPNWVLFLMMLLPGGTSKKIVIIGGGYIGVEFAGIFFKIGQ